MRRHFKIINPCNTQLHLRLAQLLGFEIEYCPDFWIWKIFIKSKYNILALPVFSWAPEIVGTVQTALYPWKLQAEELNKYECRIKLKIIWTHTNIWNSLPLSLSPNKCSVKFLSNKTCMWKRSQHTCNAIRLALVRDCKIVSASVASIIKYHRILQSSKALVASKKGVKVNYRSRQS